MNVTLETVTNTLHAEGIRHWEIDYYDDIEVWLIPSGFTIKDDDIPFGTGDTLLEAFCFSLLAFKEWKEQNMVHLAHIKGCSDYGEEYCNYNCIAMDEKDQQIAAQQKRIRELEEITQQPFRRLTLEEMIDQAKKNYPPIMPFKLISRFMGDAQVQCRCGNIYEYMRDEVMCRKCRTIFPMGLFKDE